MSRRVFLLPITLTGLVLIAIGIEFFMEVVEPLPNGVRQWLLPQYLNEASGLVVLDDDSLLTHDDERGIIYKLHIPETDTEDTSITVVARMGEPALEADFEGIARHGNDIYLITSKGLLYRLQDLSLDKNNQIVEPEIIDTGLGEICELEGLAQFEGRLLLPCKIPYSKEHENNLVVFYHDLATGETGIELSLPADGIHGLNSTNPAAIEVDADRWLIISGLRIAEIQKETQSSRVFSLSQKRHRQPEGLAVLSDASIVIVDDNRKGISRITHYQNLSLLKEKGLAKKKKGK